MIPAFHCSILQRIKCMLLHVSNARYLDHMFCDTEYQTRFLFDHEKLFRAKNQDQLFSQCSLDSVSASFRYCSCSNISGEDGYCGENSEVPARRPRRYSLNVEFYLLGYFCWLDDLKLRLPSRPLVFSDCALRAVDDRLSSMLSHCISAVSRN